MAFRNDLYNLRRLLSRIQYLRTQFSNWNEIIKLLIDGKEVNTLIHKSGITILGLDYKVLRIFKDIYENHVYTPDGFMINENDVVFDIGANVGVFSLYASTKKGTKVYSFEPHPINFELLSKNIAINSRDNINAFQIALGSLNEKRIMKETDSIGHHLLNSSNTPDKIEHSITIAVKTIETFFNENNLTTIDFLKLDCEGSEGEIINSISPILFTKIDKIVMEFHDNLSILSHNEIIEKLKSAGFKIQLEWDEKSFYGYIYAKR